MDKLGATAQDATAVMVDIAALHVGGDVANGPEDLIEWDTITWHYQENQVQRLRQRIFKATQAGAARPDRVAHFRCGGWTYQRRAGNARSAFQLSLTAPNSKGCVTRWSRSGKPGWTASNTGSGRAVDAMTRSR